MPKDGFSPLIIPIRTRHNFAKDEWKFKIPTSRKYTREYGSVYITIPPNLRKYRIKEIRILPKQKGKFLDAAFVYVFHDEQVNLNTGQAISIDLGLNNLATVVSSTDESFIIDGRWLKSKNQWFNKRRAKLVSHKDKQGIKHHKLSVERVSRVCLAQPVRINVLRESPVIATRGARAVGVVKKV
ncbi:MAG: transposase [Crocosphaera sp.]